MAIKQKLLQRLLERIENDLAFPANEVCGHCPPIVTWPNGDVDDPDPRHACSRPRLRITIHYAGDANSREQRESLFSEVVADLKQDIDLKPDREWREIVIGDAAKNYAEVGFTEEQFRAALDRLESAERNDQQP